MFPEKSLLANKYLLPLRLVITKQNISLNDDIDVDYGTTISAKHMVLFNCLWGNSAVILAAKSIQSDLIDLSLDL